LTDKDNRSRNIILYWIDNLVGTGSRLSFNLLFTLFGGVLYSFRIWPSVYVLVIFGVVSPLLYTLCLYFIIRVLAGDEMEEHVPKFLLSPTSNMLLMLLDMTIIIVFAVLIHIGILDYFLFRFLQTTLLPIVMLLMLIMLYLNITSEGKE